MKYLSICLVSVLFLFSCEKKDDTSIAQSRIKGEKYDVTLNISDFSQEIETLSKASKTSETSVTSKAAYLMYIVYNAEGQEVSRLSQDTAGNALRVYNNEMFPDAEPFEYTQGQTFGCIKDSLASGIYTVVVIASNSRLSANNRQEFNFIFNPWNDAFFTYSRGLDSWPRASDTFYKKFTLKVESKGVSKKASLDRIVGKAELNILDAKPGMLFKSLYLNENESFKFSNELPFGETTDESSQNYRGFIGPKSSFYLINTSTLVDVVIEYYDTPDHLQSTKTIKGVRFYKNKRTIISGNFFVPKVSQAGFTVNVNDKFDEETSTLR